MVSGQRKYLILSVLFFLQVIFIQGQQLTNRKFSFNVTPSETLVEKSQAGMVINYRVPEIVLSQTGISEGTFYRLAIPGHNVSEDTGKPEIPVYNVLISVPENGKLSVRISDIKTEVIKPGKSGIHGMVYPRQPERTKTRDQQRTGFLFDRETYSRRGFIRRDTVSVEYLGKLRGNFLANVSIYPVMYNPAGNELKIITSMKVLIDFFSEKDSKLTVNKESLPFAETLSTEHQILSPVIPITLQE